jgi:hypothetical protein
LGKYRSVLKAVDCKGSKTSLYLICAEDVYEVRYSQCTSNKNSGNTFLDIMRDCTDSGSDSARVPMSILRIVTKIVKFTTSSSSSPRSSLLRQSRAFKGSVPRFVPEGVDLPHRDQVLRSPSITSHMVIIVYDSNPISQPHPGAHPATPFKCCRQTELVFDSDSMAPALLSIVLRTIEPRNVTTAVNNEHACSQD